MQFPKGELSCSSRSARPPSSSYTQCSAPHGSRRFLRRLNLIFKKLLLGILQIWGVATWEFVILRNFALQKMPLGKYLTPWELPQKCGPNKFSRLTFIGYKQTNQMFLKIFIFVLGLEYSLSYVEGGSDGTLYEYKQ